MIYFLKSDIFLSQKRGLKRGQFLDIIAFPVFFQGAIATMLTQPLDVLKTRAMNAKQGDFKGPLDLIRFTASQGPMAFFKGFVPAFVRLGPHTILTFVFLEQLRMNFGTLPQPKH